MEAALYYASRSEAHDVGSSLRVKERRDNPVDWGRRPRVNQIQQEGEEKMGEDVRKMHSMMSDLASSIKQMRRELEELKCQRSVPSGGTVGARPSEQRAFSSSEETEPRGFRKLPSREGELLLVQTKRSLSSQLCGV